MLYTVRQNFKYRIRLLRNFQEVKPCQRGLTWKEFEKIRRGSKRRSARKNEIIDRLQGWPT